MITQEELKELFHYDPETGVFTWLSDRVGGQYRSAVKARRGDPVKGSIRRVGNTSYQFLCVNLKKQRAHRLAWLYVHGNIPKYIDHINGDGLDNRIANLRACTVSQNMWNARKRKDGKASRLKGALRRKRDGRWYSQISTHGMKEFLGVFDTPEEAHAAYVSASLRLHGEFARAA